MTMTSQAQLMALEWSPSETRWMGLVLVLVVGTVTFISLRSGRRVQRMAISAGILVIVASFALLAKGDRGEQHFSGDPPDVLDVEEATFRLLAVGDFGTGSDQEVQVSSAMEGWAGAHRVDAFVSAGDTIYPEGSPRYFDAAWNEPYGWVERDGLPVIGTLGNHDYDAGDEGAAVMELLGMPGRWFRVEIGDLEIIVLDSNRPDDARQERWLRRRLARPWDGWRLALFHHPPFSCSRDGEQWLQERWVPLLEDGGVDLVLSGHEHNYQRFGPASGIVYLVSGGGGDSLYPVDECPAETPSLTASNHEDYHYLVVEGSATRLEVSVHGMDGSILDWFALRRST